MSPIRFYWTWGGLACDLAHNEAQAVAAAMDPLNKFLGYIPGGVGMAIIFGVWCQFYKYVIPMIDRGNGVTLTCPWPALMWFAWWFIIPTSR